MKKVLCMLIMTIAIGIMGGGTRTYADEIKDNSEIEEQYFEILAYDAENNRSLAVLSTHNANAEVAGNGVRLRNNPNTNIQANWYGLTGVNMEKAVWSGFMFKD